MWGGPNGRDDMHHIAIAAAHTGLFRFFQLNFYYWGMSLFKSILQLAEDVKHGWIREQSALFSRSVEWRNEWIYGRAEILSRSPVIKQGLRIIPKVFFFSLFIIDSGVMEQNNLAASQSKPTTHEVKFPTTSTAESLSVWPNTWGLDAVTIMWLHVCSSCKFLTWHFYCSVLHPLASKWNSNPDGFSWRVFWSILREQFWDYGSVIVLLHCHDT